MTTNSNRSAQDAREREPRVWVVDDSTDDRDLAVRAIRRVVPGALIATPTDPESLQRLLESDTPEVVVTDYRLHWSDGLRVLDEVHARHPSVPVIMFTNTGSEEVCATGMKNGLFDYIIKRRDQFAKLPHAVVHALDYTRSQRDLASHRSELRESREQLAALLEHERVARAEAEIARAEATRATKLKDEFLATLSHELRTPLNAILGWGQLLRYKMDDRKALEQGLDVITRNARLQAQLIADLLDLSRIVSGQMRLDLQDLDVTTIVRSSVQALEPTARDKAVAVELVIDVDHATMRADPARVQQIVTNLLGNAIKFTPGGGSVRVTLDRVDGDARIAVSDTGIGIAPEDLSIIFQRFRQVDATSRRQHGGLGIGLSIVKSLAELHGGRVEARSAGAGAGSTFIVYLPLAAPGESERTQAQVELVPTAREALADVLVLVVDDDRDTCALVCRMLEEHGARVECASNAGEAFEKLKKLRPTVLISDIAMPGEDGYSLIERVRGLPEEKGGTTPATALSAFARSEDRQRALLAGFDSYAIKPVEPSELIAVVINLVRRGKRQHRGT
jgi:signal transduction histidine kinase